MSSTMSRGVGRSGAHKTIFGVKRDPKLMDPDIIRDKNMHEFPFVNADKYKCVMLAMSCWKNVHNYVYIGVSG
jgi:hypothetical protein